MNDLSYVCIEYGEIDIYGFSLKGLSHENISCVTNSHIKSLGTSDKLYLIQLVIF